MDGEGATASTDAYAIAYIVPPDPSLPESPLKAGDDPFAVDETPPTGSALTAAAKPASPWAMRASPFYLILLSLLRRVLSNRRNAGGAGQDCFLELFIRERSSKPF